MRLTAAIGLLLLLPGCSLDLSSPVVVSAVALFFAVASISLNLITREMK